MDNDDTQVYQQAQPAQEPVAWCSQCGHKCPLPPQRPWVGLTDDDIFAAVKDLYGTAESAFMGRIDDIATARAIEAASRSKNT